MLLYKYSKEASRKATKEREIFIMTEFNNYLEQVNHTVKNKVPFNKYVTIMGADMIDEMQPAIVKALEYGDVFQWFAVDIYGYENEETEKLGIFWDDTLELYILPVTHFGMLWEGVAPVDERETDE